MGIFCRMKVKAGTYMKGISVLLYSFRQGAKNLKQNRLFTLASIGTIAACLFIFGIFYSVVSNLNHMIRGAETSVGVTVFFDEGITDEQIAAIGEQIKERNEVSRIEFVSADEAWNRFREDTFGDAAKELAETFGADNPLKDSASYEVYLSDVSRQSELVSFIESIDGVRIVNSSEATAKGLTDFNKLVGYVSVAIIILLIAVSLFLISTTVSIGFSIRKKEINLMRLIGATDKFIQLPFVIEGIIIGISGAAVPLLILYLLYGRIVAFIYGKVSALTDILVFLDVYDVFRILVPVSVLMGVGIGLIGSIWTVRKHMKI